MLLTNHTLTGLALSQSISNPALLAPAAFASHLILDTFPHFGNKEWTKKSKGFLTVAIIDNLIGLALVAGALWLWPESWFHILVGVFFATLPDLLFLSDIFLNRPINNAFTRFHSRIQWSETNYGFITELAWSAAILTALYLQI